MIDLENFIKVTTLKAEKLKGLVDGVDGHFIKNLAQVVVTISGLHTEENSSMLL